MGLFFSCLIFGSPLNTTQAQTDLAGVHINTQDLHFKFLADLDHILR